MIVLSSWQNIASGGVSFFGRSSGTSSSSSILRLRQMYTSRADLPSALTSRVHSMPTVDMAPDVSEGGGSIFWGMVWDACGAAHATESRGKAKERKRERGEGGTKRVG